MKIFSVSFRKISHGRGGKTRVLSFRFDFEDTKLNRVFELDFGLLGFHYVTWKNNGYKRYVGIFIGIIGLNTA